MKILLVDDDAAIVQSLAAILQALPGHDVRGATTGGQALQTAMAMGGIDLLITDVVMEPMDGFTLRDQVATRYPNARTIFITGFDLSDYGEQTANHQVLTKPIAQADLLAAIARELPGEEAVAPERPAEIAEPASKTVEPEPATQTPLEVVPTPSAVVA
ncbi:MAG TPA: response regulator, partial [Chthoniobacteraceae bacterium]|nr:response regulator [Chthoniobacteraceae bacterium]